MRKCDECMVCCEYVDVIFPDFIKKAGEKCPFQDNGCNIFDRPERPEVCKNFQCAWLRGCGEENDRPDIIGNLVSISHLENRNWVISIELGNKVESNIIVDAILRFSLPAMIFTSYGKYLPEFVIDICDILLNNSSMCGDFIKELDGGLKLYHHRKE